ncbi:MAG: hypothetical protein ACRDXX_14015 [Stackebrandtia sp.]
MSTGQGQLPEGFREEYVQFVDYFELSPDGNKCPAPECGVPALQRVQTAWQEFTHLSGPDSRNARIIAMPRLTYPFSTLKLGGILMVAGMLLACCTSGMWKFGEAAVDTVSALWIAVGVAVALMIDLAILDAVRRRGSKKAYEQLRHLWENTWICRRCGRLCAEKPGY